MKPSSLETIPYAHLCAVLRASFDARELANCLADFGLPGHACNHTHDRAAKTWHLDPQFRKHLRNRLNCMHAPAMATTKATDPDLIRAYALTADYTKHPDFAGLVWSLASDERTAVREQLSMLLGRVQHDCLRSICA